MTEHKANIALIGFSAVGKSSVATKVAGRLGWVAIDTDVEIVKASGKSIPEIFKQDGESKFRELEHKALRQACLRTNAVIATGGGAILDAENRRLLRNRSVIVCLEAKPETIHHRLLYDSLCSANPIVRPLLAGDKPLERISQLKNARQIYYAIADWTVHTDNLNLEEVCHEVVKGWWYVHRHPQNPKNATDPDLACIVDTSSGCYPVYVGWGLLEKLGDKMKLVGLSGTANIISDETIFAIYGAKVKDALGDGGFKANYYTVPPGETSKSIEHVARIYDFLVGHRVERKDVIVALGGGMIGDLAGFVAATFLRGLSLVHIPTSLVAMADASIGGKVAVNHPKGKNLIGAFYQPRLVLADVRTLETLPKRELVSGWSEVIKHGLVLDAGLLAFLESNVDKLTSLTPDAVSKAVSWSMRSKAEVVTQDEKETGKRIVLNYGHTIGHGIEAATKFERFLHGEAVAIGMVGAAKLSNRLGHLSQHGVARHEEILRKYGLPTNCSGLKLEDVLAAMKSDKKIRSKAIRWVLLEDIGRVMVKDDVPWEQVVKTAQEVIVA
ncbi:MAG: 3-dehydroquinate synthase [Chloroflexi bacterium]|nr:3-dehydroquinate synthase [Chloroflexota bacterium]MBM4449608.1 3-dehydroquinate synthase [Chloroflexota bacterium]